jgi:uncharacterized protein (TIGR02679 family)
VSPELQRILQDLPPIADVLERAAQRYVQLSRVGGTIAVEPGERRSVERLGCRVDAPGRLRLAELDRALRASRLATPLRVVLEDYLEGPLVTSQEARAHEDAAWHELMAHTASGAVPGWVSGWLREEERALRAEWRRHDRSWGPGLKAAVEAASVLDQFVEATELPRLAYDTSGDAHTLDSDQIAGRLFERLLLHRHREAGLSLPLSAEDRETLFAMSGLAIDELSSTVHVVGLVGPDLLVTGAREAWHVLALPLRTLYAVARDIRAHRNVVFAVENRSVLSALHRELADLPVQRYPTLVCTGGHVSLATLRLLDHLTGRGATIRYSGDFDAKGLMIADALASRFCAAFDLWRMDVSAYHRALGARRIEARIEPGPLARRAAERFPGLRDAIGERGAAYQEGLTPLLIADVRQWVDQREAETVRG